MNWDAILLSIFVLLFGCREKEDDILGNLFFERSIEGGILISSIDGKTEYIYNKDRIETPYSPDATFYVLESIVALNDKIIPDEKQKLQWDGEDRGLIEWNRDQTLETAYKYSCLWANQQVADRIGLPRFSIALRSAKYGNAATGKSISSFWLNGKLTVSSRGQIDFLRKLYLEKLPFSAFSQKTVKSWMIVRKTKNYTLYAKTAWASHSVDQHGWNVGFVETPNRGTWIFSLNMKIEQTSEAPFRQEIVDEALRKKGIIK